MTTSPSENEAALKVKANQAEAEVCARRESPYRAQNLSSDHSLRPPHAARLAIDDGPHGRRRPPTALYGSPHTHVSVSSLAEAVAPS